MKLPVVQIESAALPPLYDGWVVSLLGGGIPAETNATCDDCAMCDREVAPHGGAEWYNPAVKCCTYLPKLPNFIVGRILLDPDPGIVANLGSVEARLAGANANPLGITAPAAYNSLYNGFRNRFGHSAEMLCPHYISESGRCGIWRQRNSICATWFCKHVRGAVAERFWNTLMQLLQSVERQLSVWCVNELHPNGTAFRELAAARYDGANVRLATEDGLYDIPRDSPRYRAIWGEWFGRERAFYERCAEKVSPLGWSQVLGLCGQETRMFAAATLAAYRDLLDERLPKALRMGPIQVIALSPQTVQLSGYRSFDSVEIPRELFEVLNQFDGRPTADALDAIADRHGLELGADLVRGLVDFEILKPVE